MRTADQPIRISLIAPDGRMGKAIALAVADEPGFAIDDDHGDVLVDFSVPDALQSSLDRAVSAGVPILIGTTGLDESADALIAETAQAGRCTARAEHVAWRDASSPSWSSGRPLCLGRDWDIEIVETHHS